MRYVITILNKLLVVAGVLTCACCTVFAQTKQATARFEAASIKPGVAEQL